MYRELCIGEGPVLKSFFYRQQSWDFFHFLEIVTGWLVPSAGQKIPVESLAGTTFHCKRSCLLKTGFFLRHVRELKIQRKNPGSALQYLEGFWFSCRGFF